MWPLIGNGNPEIGLDTIGRKLTSSRVLWQQLAQVLSFTILDSSRTLSCCYNSNTTANQVCHQVLIKNSREACMDKKNSEDVDIMASMKNLHIITTSIFLKIVKMLIGALQSLVLLQYCGHHLAGAAVLVHHGCSQAAVQLLRQDDSCSEARDFQRGCLWDFLPSCLGDLCPAALGLMPCCLGDLCHAALGIYAMLPLGILSIAAQRRDFSLAPQKRITQLGSLLQDYSTWLPEEDYKG